MPVRYFRGVRRKKKKTPDRTVGTGGLSGRPPQSCRGRPTAAWGVDPRPASYG
jgi:hypothetical protein